MRFIWYWPMTPGNEAYSGKWFKSMCWSSFGMDSTFQVGDSDVKRPQENVVLLACLPLLVLVSYSVPWLLLSLLPSLAIIRNQLLDSPRWKEHQQSLNYTSDFFQCPVITAWPPERKALGAFPIKTIINTYKRKHGVFFHLDLGYLTQDPPIYMQIS